MPSRCTCTPECQMSPLTRSRCAPVLGLSLSPIHLLNVIIIIAWVGIINLCFQSAIIIEIIVDIIFALTRSCNELFQLCLQILDWFLLLITHGESDLSCDYNEIMRRYCQCIAVPWGGRATLIQGIKGGSLLLLLVLAVKNEGDVRSFFLEKDEKRG